jgi:hypothetical protein
MEHAIAQDVMALFSATEKPRKANGRLPGFFKKLIKNKGII